MQRTPRERPWVSVGRVVAVCASLAVQPRCAGEPAACPDGACAPHCPVRPGQFGHYQTQWRRWPTAAPPGEKPRDLSVPVPPARSLLPRADEESPGRTDKEAPRERSATAPADDTRRLERLVAEADAARLADPARQLEFTVQLVSAMLAEHDPQARCAVLALAAGFETPAAEAICVGALDDPDPRVRLTACRVCADRRSAAGFARLVRRAREDADLGVRLRAVRALGELGDRAAIEQLVALLDDPDPAIQVRATAALCRATGQDFGTDAERWRRWAANPRATAPRWSLDAAVRSLF